MGLSGALFTQLYLALYAPDPESFLLLAAWFPALIAVLAMPAIHAVPAGSAAPDPRERQRLLMALACSCTLALGLLGANMLGKFTGALRAPSISPPPCCPSWPWPSPPSSPWGLSLSHNKGS